MKKPTILRKRFIPFEVVDISGDELLYRDEELIITRWKAIKPRLDFSCGISFTFLKKGFKISRFFDAAGNFLYWYCDILEINFDKDSDIFTLVDLLIDVKLMPDGTMKVLDADELAEALEKGLVTQEQACRSLRELDNLLRMIYEGSFPPAVCLKDEYCTAIF